MKTLLLAVPALALSLILAARGQDPAQSKLSFNHLALSVKELDRSADFYGRVLDLSEIRRDSPTKGVRWFSLGAAQELHLISHEYYRGDAVATNKAVHLALTTTRFADTLKQLDARGVAYGNWKGDAKQIDTRSDGVKQVYLQDPDGYWLELNNAAEK